MPFYLNDLGLLSALGNSKTESLQRLLAGDRQGLVLAKKLTLGHPVYVGAVNAELPQLDAAYAAYACRNNQLLLAALAQIQETVDSMLERFGPARVGVVIGTSTAGIDATEVAWAAVVHSGHKPAEFHYKQQQLGAGADFIAHHLGLQGPAYTLSTACSSSGRAFASARRLLALDLCDAVIVGGADSLCRFTVTGFSALESVSSGLCKPFGEQRDGINVAEAVALFVLSKAPGPVRLTGIGASSDAYHFSAPDPAGTAVYNAMQSALAQAGQQPRDIDYINLHGTATKLNDAMESSAVAQLFPADIAVSSSKGMTGHALGAAAALELGLCWQLLSSDDTQGYLPPNINDDRIDPTLPALNYVQPGQSLGRPIHRCQSNAFAFGGNNISIILERA